MPLVLTPLTIDRGPLAIDLSGIVPHAVRDLDRSAVARLPIRADGRPARLGELFELAGDAADETIECRGDFSRMHFLGAAMTSGRIDVAGGVGRHAGAGLAGGMLAIAGFAGDWLAVEMTGGEVRVGGSVGHNVAAALPGSQFGMRGGLVVVCGNAGSLAGARMRRGMLAIGGDSGEATGFEMRAGTVVVAGRVGAQPGLGMRRGSLVALADQPAIAAALPGMQRQSSARAVRPSGWRMLT
jgi:formylmethanofuran dehydrogenase subunit C